jgi:16S rRNA (guanine527-N7)-methyltransferase
MPKRADQPTDDPTLGSFAPADNPPKAFPEEDWAWFADGCDGLGIAGAAEHRAVLEALYGHLLGVNRWLNLTTIIAPREYLKLHILDSLALLGDPRLKHLAPGSPCVDLGSGGGYPGLPLAAWLPGVPWVLIDARKKKAEFLAAACTLTGNSAATARHLRGGEVSNRVPDLWRRCQLVTCRAMGQTADVLAEAADLVRPNGHVVIYKGPAFAGDERAAAEHMAGKLGYRLIGERGVVLEEGDPERVMLVYQRDR